MPIGLIGPIVPILLKGSVWNLGSVWADFVNMRLEIVNMRVCEWVI